MAANKRILATHRLALLVLVLLMSFWSSAASAKYEHAQPSLTTASSVFLSELQDKLRGRWAEAWRRLYPPHQRIVPLALYVRCETQTPFPAAMRDIKIERVTAARVQTAGQKHAIIGAAIAVRVQLDWYDPRDPINARYVFHLVPADGHWTWILSPSEFQSYRAGVCP